MCIKLTAIFISLILSFLPLRISRPVTATAMHTPNTVYLFVEIETKAYRKGVEISSQNPEERRWYLSNVVVS